MTRAHPLRMSPRLLEKVLGSRVTLRRVRALCTIGMAGRVALLSTAGVIGLAAFGPGATAAATPSNPSASREDPGPPSSRMTQIFDQIWGYGTFYENEDNPVLKKLALSGRFQVDFPLFDANRDNYSDPQVRRFRIGLKSRWGYDLTAHAEIDLDLTCDKGEECDHDPSDGLTDAYLGWTPSEAFKFQLGKVSAPFTLDGSTSSTRLLTLERNNLSNNLWFTSEYHTGMRASGRITNSLYQVGFFSSSTDEQFGELEGAYFVLASYGHDFSKRLEVPEFLVFLNYVFQKSDVKNDATLPLSHVASLNLRFDSGTWGVRADVSGAIGHRSQGDLVGFVLMPYYHLTDSFQIVSRYTYLYSDEQDGIRLNRYEIRIDSGRGNEYNEVFMGLNWFLYGHKFKLQTGFQYTWMESQRDYRGWGFSTGLRMAW